MKWAHCAVCGGATATVDDVNALGAGWVAVWHAVGMSIDPNAPRHAISVIEVTDEQAAEYSAAYVAAEAAWEAQRKGE